MPTRTFVVRKPFTVYRPLVWEELPALSISSGSIISLDLNTFLTSWFPDIPGIITKKAASDPLPTGIILDMGILSGTVMNVAQDTILNIVFIANVFGLEVESGPLVLSAADEALWTDGSGNALWTDSSGKPLWTK